MLAIGLTCKFHIILALFHNKQRTVNFKRLESVTDPEFHLGVGIIIYKN
jgi:hypothetical protein